MNASSGRHRRVKDVIVGVALFAALGPAIGALLILVAGIVPDIDRDKPLVDTIGTFGLIYAFSLLFAYPLAVVPAMLTGGCAGYLRHRLGAPVVWLGIGAFGAAITLAWMALIRNPLQFENEYPLSASAGFFAGVCCTWLLSRIWRRSRERPAPTPPPES